MSIVAAVRSDATPKAISKAIMPSMRPIARFFDSL
jgi:hypothetical protein